MTGALSPTHWLIILVIVLLLFGAKRLPDAARGVGRSLRIFKAETADLSADAPEKSGPAAKTADAVTADATNPADPAHAPADPAPRPRDTAA